jgi:acyl dehydratase
MSLLVADGQRLSREAAARGEELAVWGPSPGFRDLRWIRPVLAGDIVSYATVVLDKRTSASRPGWGILTSRTTGTNQRGEEVYSITASAFVPMRKAG